MNIDFVVMWVDGNDLSWQDKMLSYKGTSEQSNPTRFRDWNIFKYWFRSIERFAPWVHRVFLITDNQIPSWININYSKLKIIDHKDFIPAEYLPTFNSHTIELNIHRIEGLSEHFVVFNDDTFINAPITPEYYFKNGLPCDAPFEHIFTPRCYFPEVDMWGINIIEFCDTQVVNAHFNRKEVTKANPKGWYGSYLGWKYRLQAYIIRLFGRTEFQHFYSPHNERPFLKSIFEEAWKEEGRMLCNSCTRFRENVSLNLYFMRYWQLASNKFYPENSIMQKQVVQLATSSLSLLESKLNDANIKSLCVNDSSLCDYEDYMQAKPLVRNLFEKKLPHKSSFEL
ncbi:Stealth CR1 domain-containing protein [Prevotella histicola]